MTTKKFCTATSIMALAIIAMLGLVTPTWATYSLVWSDEFNGIALDPGNWAPDIGTGCPSLCGWGNGELEYYRSENVTVTGGNLVLTARDESYDGASFTSGKVTTRGKQTFLYGRVEMRAKIPTGGGMWPAFWMMPQDDAYGGWASSGEIDIMESANNTTAVGGALHFGDTWPSNTSTSGSYSLGGANFADDFHIYAVEWEADEIRWYVDGVLFMTRYSSQWYTNAAPDNVQAPFDQEFYIILNTAVGGFYPGCTDPGCITASFPQEFLIDYVRVYEDILNDAPTVTITTPAPSATLPVGNITIEATAADADGSVVGVEFYNGSAYLGADASAPYSLVWPSVSDGCYNIVVKAIDNLGGAGSASVDITVGLGCGQTAFGGSPRALPGRIEAEDYDTGGEGIAYQDSDPTNNGGQYRPADAVDIEFCSDVGGGYNTGWTEAGEWMEYTIDVASSGEYTIDVRVSSLLGGGIFHLEFAGVDKTGDIMVPSTSNWQNWTTVSATATLTAGVQVMRFAPTFGGFNINYFEFLGGGVTGVPDLPSEGYALHPCYPNPFNPATTISFDLAAPATVNLAIYDVAGKLVRTLVAAEAVGAGRHEIMWQGRDETGRLSAAGIYFYRLDAGDYSATRRMTLVK
ncbi:MAG: family 16 glycosylhydrolase [Candidatus Krumholzibacteria bacterium]|nr:family 16 glycosylhydrolase [Candidatus Krumholzibacteria bacterium]